MLCWVGPCKLSERCPTPAPQREVKESCGWEQPEGNGFFSQTRAFPLPAY